jgi:surface antigen
MRSARAPLHVARLLICLAPLGGCSVSMPMASFVPNLHDDETTGSIAKPQLSDWLDREDWQSAKTAFSQALDEKNVAEATSWDNPKSGTKGTFIAIGEPFPGMSGPCRAFHADIDRQATDKALEGTACANRSGEWQVTEVKPAKQS